VCVSFQGSDLFLHQFPLRYYAVYHRGIGKQFKPLFSEIGRAFNLDIEMWRSVTDERDALGLIKGLEVVDEHINGGSGRQASLVISADGKPVKYSAKNLNAKEKAYSKIIARLKENSLFETLQDWHAKRIAPRVAKRRDDIRDKQSESALGSGESAWD
jgi:hypothetical protein